MTTTTIADQSTTTLRRLVDVLGALEAAENIGEIQQIVCAAARQITDADGATYVLRDGKECHYAEEDSDQPLWKGSYFPMDGCISGWTMVYRQAVDRLRHRPRRPPQAGDVRPDLRAEHGDGPDPLDRPDRRHRRLLGPPPHAEPGPALRASRRSPTQPRSRSRTLR